jgi:hypothetical protein
MKIKEDTTLDRQQKEEVYSKGLEDLRIEFHNRIAELKQREQR